MAEKLYTQGTVQFKKKRKINKHMCFVYFNKPQHTIHTNQIFIKYWPNTVV